MTTSEVVDTKAPASVDTVTITEARGVSYRVPSGQSNSRKTNFLVQLSGHRGDRELIGIGEGQPRGRRTGDDAGDSWAFLQEVLRRCEGKEIPVSSAAEAVTAIRDMLAEFSEVAHNYTSDGDSTRPYRGTLLGVDVALLDIAARARGTTLAQLLGKVRNTVPFGMCSLAVGMAPEQAEKLLTAWSEPGDLVRISGTGDIAENLDFMEFVTANGRRPEVDHADRPLLIDLNGNLTRPQAEQLVSDVVQAASEGRLPSSIIIEQPVSMVEGSCLSALQTRAERLVAESDRPHLEVRVAADESVWDETSLDELETDYALGAVNIRPAQAGGFLASLDLAEEAMIRNPGGLTFLTRMSGASGVTASALKQLALALPQADFVEVSSAVEKKLSVAMSTEEPDLGIGLRVNYPGLVNAAEELITFPEVISTHPDTAANIYEDVELLRPLGPNGVKGLLLEREALALGLSTERFSKGAFTVTDGEHVPISFKWSRNPVSSAVALALCTHKEATRVRLQQAAVPVPQGRTFIHGDFETAKEFAERIGYPVVVKPAMGVRGIGVVAGIQDEYELDAAFQLMASSRLGKQDFIVEKHIRGSDYRIIVIDGEVVGAIRRDRAAVVGDGVSTIAELLIAKNAARRLNPHLWARLVKYGESAKHELAVTGRTLETVLPQGVEQLLANTGNLSQGGDSIDVLDDLHPTIKEACIQAVESVPGMRFCGVDFLLEDHTKPLNEQDAGICELNAHAAIGSCEYPMFGTQRDVARILMKACVEHHGLPTFPSSADEVTLRIIVRGQVTAVGYRRWLKRRADAAGLVGWVRNVAKRRVEVVLAGPTAAVTAVTASLVLGPPKAQPTSYRAEHLALTEPLRGFSILSDALPPEAGNSGQSRDRSISRLLEKLRRRNHGMNS